MRKEIQTVKGLKISHVPQNDPMFSEGPTLYIKESDRISTTSTPSSPTKPVKPSVPASPKKRPSNSRPENQER